MMNFDLPDVGPGDLITHQAWNAVLRALRSLDTRVSELEGAQIIDAGKFKIRDVYPLDIEIGKQLYVVGANFGPPGNNSVSFDGVATAVSFKTPPSSDQLLVFDIPPLVIAGDSRSVLMTVGNATGYDSRQITVRKATPTVPDGSSAVVKFVKPIGVATASMGDHVLQFSVAGSNSLDEVYTLRPVCTGNVTAAMVTDEGGATELVPPQVSIAAPAAGTLTRTVTVYVRLRITSTDGNASVQLTADSQHNPARLSGSSSALPFVIGQTWPGSPTIAFQRIGVTGQGAKIDSSTGTVSYTVPTPAGKLCSITFNAQGLRATRYTARLSWKGDPSGWTASLLGNPLDAKWPLLTLAVNSTGGSVDIPVYLLSTATATNGTFVLSMSADDRPDADKGEYVQLVKPSSN